MSVSGRKRVAPFIVGVTLLGIIGVSALPSHNVSAAQITNRSLTLQAGATDGGSKPSGNVNHYFQFTVPSVGNTSIGSIKFLYCTTASGPPATPSACTTPAGLNTGSATLDETGSAATGFSINTSTAGAPYITRSAASVTAGSVLKFKLQGVTNPDGTDCSGSSSCTFFVRISTYASTDTTGSAIDKGAVAASVNAQIQLTGIMPESLIFCTGGTIGTTSGIPDCTLATSGAIFFNQLFSPTDTATASSQMAASTNAGTGYAISVSGPTLTSGSNTIPAMTTTDTSKHGVGQFGLNLAVNTTPAIGTAITPAANGTNYKGQAVPSSGYDAADSFRYVSTDTVANSANGGAGPTDSQIYTASYIVNVTGSQAPGTYVSTLTYVCTPTF
jgi:hypothetical protein